MLDFLAHQAAIVLTLEAAESLATKQWLDDKLPQLLLARVFVTDVRWEIPARRVIVSMSHPRFPRMIEGMPVRVYDVEELAAMVLA